MVLYYFQLHTTKKSWSTQSLKPDTFYPDFAFDSMWKDYKLSKEDCFSVSLRPLVSKDNKG